MPRSQREPCTPAERKRAPQQSEPCTPAERNRATILGLVRGLVKFFRANPQAFILLVVCVVLGLGTFMAIVFGLLSSGGTPSGEPSGSIGSIRVDRALPSGREGSKSSLTCAGRSDGG